MKKQKNFFKNFFNVSFDDANIELKNLNHKIFNASIRALLIYLLLVLPIFAYIYIVFANNNLSFYINYTTTDGKHIWDLMQISNGHLVTAFLIIGLIFFSLTLLAFLFFKPIVTSKKYPKSKKYIYIIFLAVIALLSILFFGLSQFEYSRFYEYYRYSILFDNTDIKFDWAKPLTEYFLANKPGENEHDYYGWASNSMTLWMMFGQIMIAFASFLVLQNSVFVKTKIYQRIEENYILLKNATATTNETTVINNRFLRAIRAFFKNDQRNLAIYMIFGSVIVLLSSFVYSILITSSGTNIAALVNWSYRVSYLLTDLKGFVNNQGLDGYQQVFQVTNNSLHYGNLFTVTSLPIIFLGLTISMLFYFVINFVREKQVSYKIFTLQTAALFVLIILTITTMLVSKLFVYNIERIWNYNDNNIKFLDVVASSIEPGTDHNSSKELAKLFSQFAPNGIYDPAGFKIEWLSSASNIADAIITYSFITGLFIVVVINNNHLKVIGKKIARDFNKLKRLTKKGRKTDYAKTNETGSNRNRD